MNKNLKKLILAALLTALAIVIDALLKAVIASDSFGLPFYAIPLVIGCIILGPIYGIAMGFITDILGFVLGGGGNFNILFSISAVLWATIPSLIVWKKPTLLRISIAIPITYLLASLSNTFALWIVVSKNVALSSVALRMAFIPLNAVIMIVIVHLTIKRLMSHIESFWAKAPRDFDDIKESI